MDNQTTNSPDQEGKPKALGRLREVLSETPNKLALIADEQARAITRPGTWSLKQELGHLIDSAANSHRRLVLVQLEDNPDLPDYDGDRWVIAQAYQEREWLSLVDIWRQGNQDLLDAAEALPHSAWSRTCRIAGSAPLTLRFVIDDYVAHMERHLAHIISAADERPETVDNKYRQKIAPVNHPILELLARRWSPVAFDENREVERWKVLTLLEAARWAPSSFNDQPWQYLVFDRSGPDALERARACLVPGNAWAKKSPLLMLSVARENFSGRATANRHAHHDVGMASENLVLQATELGLVAHQMAGFDAARARLEFGIPDGFTPMAMIAIGHPYRGKIDDLDDKLRARELGPRVRKPLSEVGFAGKWGVPYSDL